MRILYFDIDGVINNYEDRTKPMLAEGRLQKLLNQKGFTRLVCVSGWATMIRDSVRNPYLKPSLSQQVESLRTVIADAFPDAVDFQSRCELRFENDTRARHIDLTRDWYYIDDWAKEFFEKTHGTGSFDMYSQTRILMCDPFGDGSDILDFLNTLPEI